MNIARPHGLLLCILGLIAKGLTGETADGSPSGWSNLEVGGVKVREKRRDPSFEIFVIIAS